MLPKPKTDEELYKHILLNKPVKKDILVNEIKQSNAYNYWKSIRDIKWDKEVSEFEQKLKNGSILDE